MSLDIEQPEALVAWLRATGRVATNGELRCRRLAGGVSNRTMWVDLPGGERWVLKQALARLRVATEWYSPPERVHREALGLRWLQELAPPGSVVRFRWEDFEEHVLAMDAVPEPHENWKLRLLEGRVEPERVEAFGRLLGTLHRRSGARAMELAGPFGDRSYFESLRLEPYYGRAAEVVPEASSFMRALIEETLGVREALVHGDFSPKNVLVCGDRMVLLDHEVIHWGDPAFDLGFALTHLLAKALHCVPARVGFLDAARHFWRAYQGAAECGQAMEQLEPRAVRHTLGCLLARVAGRSPLEYLNAAEREVVRRRVLALQRDPPVELEELISSWADDGGF
jgi:aminoglycoside phosphotransferase (APT) family kinase protein